MRPGASWWPASSTPRPSSPSAPTGCSKARARAGLAIERPAESGLAPVAAVHTPAYLRFLETIHARWRAVEGASDEVLPNVHLDRTLGGYPTSPIGLAAFHQADTACPIGAGTWEGACWSARTAIAATEAVLAGERAAYALCRPPGHHAYADLGGRVLLLEQLRHSRADAPQRA